MALEINGEEVVEPKPTDKSKKLSEMSGDELEEVFKDLLPEDMEEKTLENVDKLEKEISEKMNDVVVRNQQAFGEDYDRNISALKEKIYGMVEKSNDDSERMDFFDILDLIVKTARRYTSEDNLTEKEQENKLPGLETDRKLIVKQRYKEMLCLSFRQLLLIIRSASGGTFEDHEETLFVNQICYNIFNDALNIGSLYNTIDSQLVGFEYKESRYLDSNYIKPRDMQSVLVGVVMSLNKLVDTLIEESIKDEKDKEDETLYIKHRSDAFYKVITEYLQNPDFE